MLNLSPASIPATHTRIVHSAMANDDYLISVALPFHYEERPDTVWPVIYVLDGKMHCCQASTLRNSRLTRLTWPS